MRASRTISCLDSPATGNALNCSAALFEALADIDTKYAKIADKEYDGISAEVKKWFKRLAVRALLHIPFPF